MLEARSSRSCWCRRARWRATWWAGARDSRASVRARSTIARALWRSSRAAWPRSAVAGGGAVDRHGRLGGVGRRRAGDRGDVVDQRVVGVVADGGDDGHAQHRHGAAQRLVAEREQVGERAAAARDDDHLDGLAGREVLQRARDRRRGVPVLDRRERPHDPAAPAAAAQPGQHVVARLAALAGDDADRARQGRTRQPLLRLRQALVVQRAAQPLDLGQQVALAGQPQAADGEGELRRGGARARVVVAAARGDDLRPVGEIREPERVPVAPPHRARQRSRAVAQLEPHARAAGLEAEHLAEDLDAGELAQALAEARRVVPDGERPREPGAGDALRPLGGGAHRVASASARATAGRSDPHGTATRVFTPIASKAASRSGSAVRRGREGHRVDQIGGERAGRALAVAAEERLLALARRLAVARALGELDVEVLRLRPHRAEVERQPRAHGVARRVDVGLDGHRGAGRDVDVRAGAAGLREAAVQRLEQGRGVRRVEHERQPAVGDLAHLLDGLRADGAEVDRDPLLDRLGEQLQRLRAVERHAVLAALVDQRLAGQHGADDLDVLARAADGPRERDAVPALGDLRARHAEPEPEAAVRQHVERRRGHRGRGRGARGDLEQARAERDPLGLAGEQPEHRDRVLPPRLRDPHGVQPELVGEHRELHLLVGGEPGPVGEEEAGAHAQDPSPASGRPRPLACFAACPATYARSS